MPDSLVLRTDDGLALEAELALAGVEGSRCGMVLCHPHPQYGGTMRSLVIGALFQALPARGVTCLRFNFRGVEGSTGTHDHGNLERLDVEAAVRALSEQVIAAEPLVLTGWSFGADMALSVRDDRVAGWMAIAPPLRIVHDVDGVAGDPRPKLLALAEHDEVRAAREVQDLAGQWTNADVRVVGGASHFFIGRTDRLVELATEYVDRVAPSSAS